MGKGSLIARAAAGVNLTPGERAVLRALEGLVATIVVAAITAAAPLLAGGSPDWATVGHVALAAGITAALLAILKYAKAFGDAPLAAPSDAPALTIRVDGRMLASTAPNSAPAVDMGASPVAAQPPAPQAGA